MMIDILYHPRWCDNATAGLTHALRDDLPLLKAQVNQGLAQLWEINSPKGKSWMISRAETLNDEKELVICCYEGCDLQAVAPLIYRSAEQQGFASIRFHTQRQGLNRLIGELGFTPYEIVYKKQFNHKGGR